MEGAIMALRRQKNNIINLALVIANEDEKAGMTIDQTMGARARAGMDAGRAYSGDRARVRVRAYADACGRISHR